MRALKEWSSIVGALESGDQLVILRKGGILDVASGFKFEKEMFALFPTHEHQDASSIKPEYQKYLEFNREHDESYNTVGSYATVIAESDILTQGALDALSSMHIWSEQYIAQRKAWKPERPIRAALLQVSTTEHVRVNTGAEHAGCKSWIDINCDPVGLANVIDDTQTQNAKLKFEEALKA